MSFNPQTGLVYLPAQNVPGHLTDDKNWKHELPRPATGNGGTRLEHRPRRSTRRRRRARRSAACIAWDPVKQKEVWRARARRRRGTAARSRPPATSCSRARPTAASSPTTRRPARSSGRSPTGTGVGRGAIDLHGRRQAVRVGRGRLGRRVRHQRGARPNARAPGTVYTFAVGGNASCPTFATYQPRRLVAGVKYEPEGRARRARCSTSATACICHGVPGVDRGGNVQTSATVATESIANLERFVFKGPFTDQGMPDFTGKLTRERRREAPGLHPGHGRRDPAEVTKSNIYSNDGGVCPAPA